MRSWWHHEQVSIAAAKACDVQSPKGTEDSHGGGGEDDAQRATAPEDSTSWGAAGSPEGSRAAGGSHGRLRGCPGASRGGAGAARRDVDGTTLRFLLEQYLSLKKQEEEEEKERKRLKRRQVLLKEFFALADVPVGRRSPQQVSRLEALDKALDDDLAASSSQPSRRKRKKKRKKRLPRTRCLPRGFAGGDAPRVMFPSVVVRPEMLCIMADMDQKDRCSGISMAVLDGDNAPRAVFSSLVGRPRMPVILADMDQKNSCCGMFKTGFTGCPAPRAVSVSLVRRPVMLGILAGMDQDDSCCGMYKAGYAGCELCLVRQRIHAVRQSTEYFVFVNW